MADVADLPRRHHVGAVAALALACTAAVGCSRGTVALRYLYPEGRLSSYRWSIDGATTGGPATHTIHLVLGVDELVLAALPGGSARLRLVLSPMEAVQDDHATEMGPPITVELEVGPDGSVGKVVGASNLPAGALTSLELDRLLSESRPVLPHPPVPLHAHWRADLLSGGPSTNLDLRGSGTLDRFALAQARRLAEISIHREGTVGTHQTTPQGTVTLAGKASDRATARLDLDRGVLVEATSRTTSTFEVSGDPADTGELRVDLTTSVVLAGVAGG